MDNLGLVLEQLKQLKDPLNQKFSSDQKPERPLGVWKEKVKMPDAFDELSSDILSEFGIEE
ncbi:MULTISPECIES: hypothetical protein [unclassified Nodularia (in: cyanobacteria)]|uniref:hypothetical protein n=1 Tax=unclassified Nodularia (in: cyanobacteria) TaxID=2656917 RepID=UPI00187FBB88|nr:MULTISPECIES: hypothetical protein [unclassified Nodularia (in: cyanobacteria)]MBE9199474.1 hypothetical protein [Nodularia sp. LEGE 06071]MCC2695240.1 hypothetical protein [Nodularia sp. LEGE 04288]